MVLHQNFPNPFNPVTTIAFELSYMNNVEIQVFNALGREVRTLLNTNLPAGDHSVEWDGMDDQGNAVAPGVYVYRMIASNRILVRRMLLLE